MDYCKLTSNECTDDNCWLLDRSPLACEHFVARKDTRTLRVLRKNFNEWVMVLTRAGHLCADDGPASSNWGNGCADPECCWQHPYFDANGNMDAYMDVRVSCSGNEAHRLWVAAGNG